MTLIDDGSRFVPWSSDHITGLEHVHRYLWAQPFVANKRVMDIASGEGYGAALLAQTARQVIGIDLEVAAVRHARQRYPLSNLTFVQGNAQQLGLAPRSIDVIVCFETLEHITTHDDLLASFRSALTEDGLLFISTPNKQVYTDDANYHNPHHVRELYHMQFNDLLKRYFAHVNIFGQTAIVGSVLSQNQDGVFLHDAQPLKAMIFEYTAEHRIATIDSSLVPRYLVACCSQQSLPQGISTLLLNSQPSAFDLVTHLNNALNEGKEFITHQARQMESQNVHLQQAYDDSVAYVRQVETNYSNIQTVYQQAIEHIRSLEVVIKNSQIDHDEAVTYVRTLETNITTYKNKIVELETHFANLQQTYTEAVTYVRTLESQAQNLENGTQAIKKTYDEAVTYARSLETKIHDLEENLRQFTDIRR